MDRLSEKRFLSNSTDGIATVASDPAMTLLDANEPFCTFAGIDSGDTSGRCGLSDLLKPEAARILQEWISQGLSCFAGENLAFQNPGAGDRYFRVTGIRVEEKFYKDIYPVYHLVFSDSASIHELKRIIAFEKRKQDVISALSEDITFEYDYSSDTLVFSEKYRSVFGRDPVIPAFRERLLGDERIDNLTEAFREQFGEMYPSSGKPVEARVHTQGGEYKWFSFFCTPLEDESDRPVKAVGIIRDIDRHKKEQLRLLDKSRLDSMTGLLNKKATESMIRSAIETAGPDNAGVLLMIDIDSFKNVNDTLGHLAGDEVILQIAQQLRRTFREDDIIGRVGGDEFHVFMRHVRDTRFVGEKAQGLCRTVQGLFGNGNDGQIVTISIGIATTGENKTYHEIYRQADIALYRAKAGGKNRFVFYGQELKDFSGPDNTALPSSVNSARDRILVDIIDILFSVSDLRKGIDKVIEFLGNALQVDRILVFEKSLDLKTISMTHEWARQPEWRNREKYDDCPVAALNMPKSCDVNGIYYCSDLGQLADTEKSFLKGAPASSYLQCDIAQEGENIGYIAFEERNRKRIWTQQEIDALMLMSRLMGESIRQHQSLSLLRHSYHTTKSILNGLNGAYIYVIDENRNILYFNEGAAELHPRIKVGMKCFSALKNRSEPCETCPEKIVREKGHFSAVLHDTPFGDSMNVSVSRALWENREWVYVALFSEHLPTVEEREQQQKKAAYIAALCNTCDHITDIDVRTGRCEILAFAENRRSYDLPESCDYTPFLEFVAHTYVKEAFREPFLEKFNLQNMLDAFSKGLSSVEMEYELRNDEAGTAIWKERTAFPYKLDDGSLHIIFHIRDITQKKQEEQRRKRDENNFIAALQSNYAEIYHIDLENDLISPLYYNKDQIPIPSGSMGFSEFVEKRAADRVHPDYMQTALDFYSPEHLRKKLARQNVPEVEYRKRQTIDGDYRWVVATVRPVRDESGKAVLFLRDVTQLKTMEQAVRSLEKRYNAVFRQTVDVFTEISLETEEYSRTFFPGEKTDSFVHGHYSDDFVRFLELVHPDDRAELERRRNIRALRQAYEDGAGTDFCQYRILSEGAFIWIFSRLFFLKEENGVSAFILARNITAQKRIEEERDIEAQRFNLAIRNTYNEIYETDLNLNVSRLIYRNNSVLVPPDENEEIAFFLSRCIHPEDRSYFTKQVIGRGLLERFTAGETEIHGEYRRLGYDKQWYWVSVILVPLYSSYERVPQKALGFVRDITEKKKQEQQQRIAAQYDQALRQIYDELYEINVTSDSYRIVYHVDGKYKTPANTGNLGQGVLEVASNMIHPEDAPRFLEFFDLDKVRQSFREGQEYRIAEFRKLWLDGTYHWASLTVFPVPADRDGDEIYLVFIMDIDDKKRAEEIALQKEFLEKQRIADERYKTIVEQTDTLVFEWGAESGSRYVSPEIPARFEGNYDERNLLRVWKDDDVIHPDDVAWLDRLESNIRQQSHVEIVGRLKKRDGRYAWNRVTLSCLCDLDGNPVRYVGTINDVDNETRSVQALKYRAEFDVLTGIYNMQTFYDRASQMMESRPGKQFYIIRLDIDRFKVINDLYGLEEGDRLLRTIAGILSEKLVGHAVYGRISGDIFCACVDYDREEVIGFVHEVAAALSEYPLASRIIPSFGICQVDNVQTPINVLCDWANLALKTVKGSFYPLYAFYDETLRDQILSEKKIESEMDSALENGEFLLYFQPKVDIATSRIVGAEGLVRWAHPVEGMIPPDRFIPLFEKNGFIIQLDEFVWEQACICLRKWIDQGLEPVPVSVNVSRMHIHDNGFVTKLAALIDKYRLSPELLELELTESIFFENAELLIRTIRRLQEKGFRFSMDDFGAGYSSLNMLKSLPVETIKLDRGFFNEVIVTSRGKTVVAHTISLAKALNIEVVAEGVENREQAEFLVGAGCSIAQGYYYSMPVSAPKFETMAFEKKYLHP